MTELNDSSDDQKEEHQNHLTKPKNSNGYKKSI